MRDPLAAGLPPFLDGPISRFGEALALPVFSVHFHEIFLAAVLYQFFFISVSPIVSSFLFPKTYPQLSARTKVNWDVHMVSFFQSCMITTIGLYVLFFDEHRNAMDFRERIWGYDGALGLIVALAVGYFSWDLIMCAIYVDLFGVSMIAHAVSALAVYSFGFRPFVQYYGPIFIMFEASSPFLNIHWFCDKLNMTGSRVQWLNGICLLTVFFFSRLVWGGYNCFRVFPDILKAMDYQNTPEGLSWLASTALRHTRKAAEVEIQGLGQREGNMWRRTIPHPFPKWLGAVYLASYLILMILNVHWFFKMIQTVRARFEQPWGTKPKAEKKIVMGRGIDEAGTKSVAIDAKEVRQRSVKRRE